MKKTTLGALTVALTIHTASAGEWQVYATEQEGVSGPQQIVNALNAAGAGDTIVVHKGTYDFTGVEMASGTHLTVSKAVNIVGETDGHWLDDVVFTGTGRALQMTGDVAMTVSGITFQGFATSGNGGAVLFKSDWDAASATHGDATRLTNCVFRACTANIAGATQGGLAIDCLYEKNKATSYTGAAQKTRLINCTLRENTATSYYGAAENPMGAFGCLFEGNTVSAYSSALSINGNTPGIVVSNCTFRNNTTGGNIGTIGLEGMTSTLPLIIDCVFEGNAAKEGSAIGVRRSRGALPVIDCRFTANTNSSDYHVYGATLYADRSNGNAATFFVDTCTFASNYAACVGTVATHGTFTNCTFEANLSDKPNALAGDSLYAAPGERLVVQGCRFVNHHSNRYNWGGAIAVPTGGSAFVDDSLFATNTHTYGAAFYIATGGTCAVSRCSFVTNVCNSVGGAVYVEGAADADVTSFSNCCFTGNWASSGSAARGGRFFDCTFSTNRADAGVIYAAYAEGCRFVGNTTTRNVTGVDAEASRLVRCDLTSGGICLCSLDSCHIHDFTASHGNGLKCVFFNANWATNCVIDHCYGDWGILYSQRGTRAADTEDVRPEWVNCTFADNTFWRWYGFYCHDGTKTQLALFENCIFSNNRFEDNATACDFSIYQNMNATDVTLRNCLYGNLVDGNYCYTNFVSEGCVPFAEAGFARGKKGMDEYALLRLSPAKDKGFAQPWQEAATDYAGKARVFDGQVDIGAYECDIPKVGAYLLLK